MTSQRIQHLAPLSQERIDDLNRAADWLAGRINALLCPQRPEPALVWLLTPRR